MSSRLIRIASVAAVVVASTAGIASPAFAQQPSQVSVVHGIPGQPVDVYVNGKKTVENFQPSTVAGPLELAAGNYDVALTKPGEAVTSALLQNKSLAVPAGKNLSVAAHLDAAGKPVLTAFVNDTAMIAAGKARLVVRHLAAAPAVDVRAGGKPVFSALTNPNEVKADLPAGTVNADVVLAGTSTVAIGPKDVDLKAGTSTIVYAVGSAEGKTLGLAAQTISGLAGAPTGMPAGRGPVSDGLGSISSLLLAGVALGGVAFVTRRVVRHGSR
ncbi:DUF4397 domain-containing protein [Lentzea flaviverrucosa]|uniref:DUF4397 domain-containing protein n=1 Tax=Lentzea flaviverrucosa TaxID=200379 RepID=A0A1H9H811_9PSEU|nr:DUF4397 domain-containing protein [Lentzea flaviverrucosa]RDI34675.1 uncharacterized protein DUF4397 [Lentzea flaviverrucosa]SEQ58465.1 protein of unknown function [Lentzea flaviverrucosa]